MVVIADEGAHNGLNKLNPLWLMASTPVSEPKSRRQPKKTQWVLSLIFHKVYTKIFEY
jgi:hypothetical protein